MPRDGLKAWQREAHKSMGPGGIDLSRFTENTQVIGKYGPPKSLRWAELWTRRVRGTLTNLLLTRGCWFKLVVMNLIVAVFFHVDQVESLLADKSYLVVV